MQAPYKGSLEGERALIAKAREQARGAEVWRAVAMTDPEHAALAEDLSREAELLVLDSGHGGTGQTFRWSDVPDAVKERSLLAGGIDHTNLAAALAVGTRGLDLNSGLESQPGRKDTGLIARAFQEIRTNTEATLLNS